METNEIIKGELSNGRVFHRRAGAFSGQPDSGVGVSVDYRSTDRRSGQDRRVVANWSSRIWAVLSGLGSSNAW